MRSLKPSVGFIFITALLDVLGFGLLIPVAPKLVESLLHGGKGGNEAEAAPYVSLLMTTWYAMSFLFAPTLGALSDKFGRRPILLIALFGSGIDFFVQAIAPNLTWLFITRAINGVSGASMTVASAYIADVTPPHKRAAAFGMLGAAFGVGFVIGPFLGGVLGEINLRLPFYISGCLCLINWLYGIFVLPESLPHDRRNTFSLRRANPFGAFFILKRNPFVARMAASIFFLSLAMFGLHGVWALSMSYRFQWTPHLVGASLAVVGIGAAVVQGGLARRLIPKLGERRSVIYGLAIGTLAYVGYGAATDGWMIYAIILVASLGAIGQPAAQSMITHSVKPTEQGAVQGALAGLQSIAGIIGPLIGGTIFSYFISGCAPITLDGAPFFSSAILAAIGWVIATWAASHYVAPPPHVPEPTPADKPLCPSCGYDLSGLEQVAAENLGICPECGTEFQRTPPPAEQPDLMP